MKQDADIVVTFDMSKKAGAEALVTKAFAEIDQGYPAIRQVDAKRRARAKRVHKRIPAHARDFIVGLVAQWLSAREAQSAATKARQATEGVKALVRRIKDTSDRIGDLDRALRFAPKTDEGAEVQGLAQLISASLAEAARALSRTSAWADDLADLLPANAKGQRGVVGALSPVSANEWLLSELGKFWRDIGLSLAGGEDGDGLDIVARIIIGDSGEAEKALAACRSSI